MLVRQTRTAGNVGPPFWEIDEAVTSLTVTEIVMQNVAQISQCVCETVLQRCEQIPPTELFLNIAVLSHKSNG